MLLLHAVVAAAQTPAKFPPVVERHLASMSKECRDAGGKPGKAPDLLLIADLTGDGIPDYVVNEGAFNCDGAASLFSGSGGSQVSVYIGTRDGQAVPAFASGTNGVKIDRSTKPATLMLVVGGPLCGQKVTAQTSRGAYLSCWRPVLWNASSTKLEFAPVSMAKPVQ